ncbi:hypothetical protein pb186bvf_019733 [Paramecium bursaria]
MRQLFNQSLFGFCNISTNKLSQSAVREKLYTLSKGQIYNLQQYLKNSQQQDQQQEIQLHKDIINSIDQQWRINVLKDIAFFYLNNGLQDHTLMKKIFDHINNKIDGQFEKITDDQYSQILRIANRLYPSSAVKIQSQLQQAIQICIKQLIPNSQNFGLFNINNILGGLIILNNSQYYSAIQKQISTLDFSKEQLTPILEYLHTVIKTNDQKLIQQGQRVFQNIKPKILAHKFSDSELQRLLNVCLMYNITDPDIIQLIAQSQFNITETTLYFFLQIMQRKCQILPYIQILQKLIPICDKFIKQNKNVQLFYKMYFYPLNLDLKERALYLQNYQSQKEYLQQYYNTFNPQKQIAFLLTLLTNESTDKQDTIKQLEQLKDKIEDRFLIDTLYKLAIYYQKSTLVEDLINIIIKKNITARNQEQLQQIRTLIDFLGRKYPQINQLWRHGDDQKLESHIQSQIKENINRNELIVDAKSQYILSDQLKEYSFEQYLLNHFNNKKKRIYKESRVGYYFIDFRITDGISDKIEYDDPKVDRTNKNDLFIELNGLNHYQNNQEIHYVQKMRQQIFLNKGINLKTFSVPQYSGKLLYLEKLFNDL